VSLGLSHLLRLSRAGYVFAREGVLSLVDTRPLPMSARMLIGLGRMIERPSARSGSGKLSAALTRLGPTYVKLGQFLATRPDVVGQAIARDLESLQDKMAPFPQEQAEAAVAAAFGQSVDALFASFGPPVAAAFGQPVSTLFVSFGQPVAAASIAQVHKAEIDTPDGRKPMAVKVLRPNVERRLRSELESCFLAGPQTEAP
jgi:ubiquinone biosynthesis protein